MIILLSSFERIEQTLERLERIGEMLYWVDNELQTARHYLDEPPLFARLCDLTDRVKVLRHQYARMVRIWNGECERLRIGMEG